MRKRFRKISNCKKIVSIQRINIANSSKSGNQLFPNNFFERSDFQTINIDEKYTFGCLALYFIRTKVKLGLVN